MDAAWLRATPKPSGKPQLVVSAATRLNGAGDKPRPVGGIGGSGRLLSQGWVIARLNLVDVGRMR
jgi:hypothetical protein